MAGWVHGARVIYSWLSPKHQYMVDDTLRNTPVIGPILTAQDNTDYAQDYLDNTGQDWSDIKYHKLNLGYGAALSATVNFVSRNIEKLYGKKGD